MGSKQIGGGIVIFDVSQGISSALAESGTGIVGGKVRLGINPLLANTTITVGDFNFLIFKTGSVGGQAAVLQITGDGSGGNPVRFGILSSKGGSNRFLRYDQSVVGLVVSDAADATGIVKDGTITAAVQLANPNAYVTTDCLGGGLVNLLNLRTQTTTQTATLYAVPVATNQLLRVNAFLQITGLGATTNVQMKLIYTDEIGNVQTVDLINTGVFNPDNTLSPAVIYAEKATNVQLRVELNIPGATYNLYATCEYLGIQN